MLTGIPLLHYFTSKNDYTGAHKGMRYYIHPGKQTVTVADGTEREEKTLTVTLWPEPWALEKTDPALRTKQVYPMTEDGRAAAIAWICDEYEARRDVWDNCPGILDCEPWSPPKEPTDPAEKG